ncbi:hypothetical protein EOA27_02010 [Mesorhizobium sp. M2A.F.Ca.ET.037.01.1.1]|uniref:hypothetical protein n=1 Tax=unclassified Mesorhizobium TaxID=325217 RepID=UPI000F751288|nr:MULTISPECIES: hypothetical protein [unclassified Mesorhizobium]RUY10822.1 hypothetical protein EOA25_07640 [Mesorhizobium sp. M2A.F.Ca.ET.040.01.1.1]RVC70491.1 hypothetical protein EN759_03760 [Mesorhizobium sp. M00.F.Ca.ET.038.03.1.1]RVC82170.1 hypothetical protein EN766_01695 [Mesorhizobium sp. M2A.F.Ca.ET.046.02.1.1]AZO33939.1 hypothetical protein EJ072_04990 [Mesorhizobium sp. M2A.F.Ca.ET.046.03.2.1]RUX22930.1 hypothetical protein EOA27_02010 [Mesorhizobium sp. M2A.F.Ca.ET.037.01.1.1]
MSFVGPNELPKRDTGFDNAQPLLQERKDNENARFESLSRQQLEGGKGLISRRKGQDMEKAQMAAYRSAATWIETALDCFVEAAERMPEYTFLAEHHSAHDAPRTPAGDLVAGVLERERCRSFPERRND